MIEKKITVIVPVYNVEKYLDKCIESITGQTYENLEIILVDDGSTDKSGKICDKWKEKDKRIKVIHKENGGLSDARNVGIENSTGDFISFVDSDDMLVDFIYEKMINRIDEECLDIAIFNYCKINEDDDVTEKNFINDFIYEDEKKYELLYFGSQYTYAVIANNKIFNKRIFDNIRFPVGKVNEDEFIIHEIFECAKRIGAYADIGYKYRCRSDSITNVYNKKRLDAIEAIEERLNYIKYKKLPATFYEQTVYYCKYELIQHSIMIQKYYHQQDKWTILKELRRKYRDINQTLTIVKISKLHRVKFKIYESLPLKLGINILCFISKC